MKKKENQPNETMLPVVQIKQKIYCKRGMKVMLDKDLAELYGVKTEQVTRQVRRNIERFPEDFMFQLTKQEFDSLICHFGRTKQESRGGTRKLPLVFTEQGVAMLSGVLRSKRAIQVNIQIMRAFIRLRQMMISHEELCRKVEKMEKKYDAQFKAVFEAIKQLVMPMEKTKRKIGF